VRRDDFRFEVESFSSGTACMVLCPLLTLIVSAKRPLGCAPDGI
jgi:hypothetical protein